jgi:hypothetical protein
VKRTTTKPTARYCAYCANGAHRLCTTTTTEGTCECSDRKHDPEVRVAAAMRIYTRPELSHSEFTVEQLASQWRDRSSLS